MAKRTTVNRASTSSTLAFGLVSLPVKLYTATEDRKVSFNQLHAGCEGRIRYAKACESCGETVEAADIVKGYRHGKDAYVVVTEQDLESLPLPSLKQVAIERFVDAAELPLLMLDKLYYVAPADPTGRKAYTLLRRAMGDKVGVARIAFRDRERLAAIRVLGDAIILQTMRWPDEVRDIEAHLIEAAPVTDAELTLARMLVEQMTGPLELDGFEDGYRAALLALVEAKVAGNVIALPKPKVEPEVADLMAALQASVEQSLPQTRAFAEGE